MDRQRIAARPKRVIPERIDLDHHFVGVNQMAGEGPGVITADAIVAGEIHRITDNRSRDRRIPILTVVQGKVGIGDDLVVLLNQDEIGPSQNTLQGDISNPNAMKVRHLVCFLGRVVPFLLSCFRSREPVHLGASGGHKKAQKDQGEKELGDFGGLLKESVKHIGRRGQGRLRLDPSRIGLPRRLMEFVCSVRRDMGKGRKHAKAVLNIHFRFRFADLV